MPVTVATIRWQGAVASTKPPLARSVSVTRSPGRSANSAGSAGRRRSARHRTRGGIVRRGARCCNSAAVPGHAELQVLARAELQSGGAAGADDANVGRDRLHRPDRVCRTGRARRAPRLPSPAMPVAAARSARAPRRDVLEDARELRRCRVTGAQLRTAGELPFEGDVVVHPSRCYERGARSRTGSRSVPAPRVAFPAFV